MIINQAFIVCTYGDLWRDVDTIISGPDAAQYAETHMRMLREEFGADVKVYMVQGPDAARIAEDVADELREGKPFGRKAFARWSTPENKVGGAQFIRSVVVATFG